MTMNGWRRRLGGGWLLALLLLALPAAVYAQATPAAPPDGVVARLSFADQADLQWLSVRYDVWRVDHAAREVTVWLSAAELRQVQVQSRRVIVDQAATDDFYAAQSTVNTAQSDSGIPGFACYRTVEETHASMAQLAADYPTLVREVTLGHSWQWEASAGATGYTIPGIVLTNQAITGTKPIFFLMAAIHAREYTTAESAMRFAEQLVHGYGRDPDATWLLDYTEIHVVPQANPRWAQAGGEPAYRGGRTSTTRFVHISTHSAMASISTAIAASSGRSVRWLLLLQFLCLRHHLSG
jgi:carboxypeptidase T